MLISKANGLAPNVPLTASLSRPANGILRRLRQSGVNPVSLDQKGVELLEFVSLRQPPGTSAVPPRGGQREFKIVRFAKMSRQERVVALLFLERCDAFVHGCADESADPIDRWFKIPGCGLGADEHDGIIP
jgi:hypothetical protein